MQNLSRIDLSDGTRQEAGGCDVISAAAEDLATNSDKFLPPRKRRNNDKNDYFIFIFGKS
jgi:hypothetical protein